MTDDLAADVHAAVAAAVDRLREFDDLTAFHAANELSKDLFAEVARLGAVRAQAARNIRDARGLSLAQLAELLGVSRARAQQLVQVSTKGVSHETESTVSNPPPTR